MDRSKALKRVINEMTTFLSAYLPKSDCSLKVCLHWLMKGGVVGRHSFLSSGVYISYSAIHAKAWLIFSSHVHVETKEGEGCRWWLPIICLMILVIHLVKTLHSSSLFLVIDQTKEENSQSKGQGRLLSSLLLLGGRMRGLLLCNSFVVWGLVS
jgi:hypothetical protein